MEKRRIRELEPIQNVTEKMIAEANERLEKEGILVDVSQVYSDYWKGKSPISEERAVAIRPGITETEGIPVIHALRTGHLLQSPAQASKKLLPMTRTFLDKKTLRKGVGRLYVASKDTLEGFSEPRMYWYSVGGVVEGEAIEEFTHGYGLAGLFHSIFGEYPPLRLVYRAYDITEPLIQGGLKFAESERHFQLEIPIDTPVRNSYCYFIANLDNLWLTYDIETEEGKLEALKDINALLTAYPSKYFDTADIQELSLTDIEKVLELVIEKRKLYVGDEGQVIDMQKTDYDELTEEEREAISEASSFTEEDEEEIRRLTVEIEEAGYAIARIFYERNKSVVEETVRREMNDLAAIVGFLSALGVKTSDFLLDKDISGGTLGDFDTLGLEFSSSFAMSEVNHSGSALRIPFRSNAAETFTSVMFFSAMHGMDVEEQQVVLHEYIQSMIDSYGITISSIDKLPLDEAVKEKIRNYHRSLGNRELLEEMFESKRREERFLTTLVVANRQIYRDKYDAQNLPEWAWWNRTMRNRFSMDVYGRRMLTKMTYRSLSTDKKVTITQNERRKVEYPVWKIDTRDFE